MTTTHDTTNHAEQDITLCALFGSKKQIAWAEDLRRGAIEKVEDVFTKQAEGEDFSFVFDEVSIEEQREAWLRFLKTQDSAAKWIDTCKQKATLGWMILQSAVTAWESEQIIREMIAAENEKNLGAGK